MVRGDVEVWQRTALWWLLYVAAVVVQPENIEINREGVCSLKHNKFIELHFSSLQMVESFYLFTSWELWKSLYNYDFETPLNILILRQIDFAKAKCQIPRPIELLFVILLFLKDANIFTKNSRILLLISEIILEMLLFKQQHPIIWVK